MPVPAFFEGDPMFALTATRITAACAFLGCAVAYVVTLTYPAGVATLPKGILILMGACSLILFFRSPDSKEKPFIIKNPRSFMIGATLSFAYVATIYLVGYYVASILFLISLSLSLRYKKRLVAIAVALFYAVSIYISFQFLLKIPMPQGLLL